jgi:hypothetical protein
LIGFVLALVVAAVTVLIKDQFDDSIRIPEDIETKLPLLGVVPQETNSNVVEALDDPKAAIAEAYNSLRGPCSSRRRKGCQRLSSSLPPSRVKVNRRPALLWRFRSRELANGPC